MNRKNQTAIHRPRGFSLLELLVAMAVIAILGAMLLPALARTRESARRSVCAGNLKQWATIFHLYSMEHNGFYPDRQHLWPGMRTELLGVDLRALYPEYLADSAPLSCSSDSGVDSGIWGEGTRPLEEGRAEIRALIQGGHANANCLLAHLSMPRSYVYFGYAVESGTAAEIAWGGVEEAGVALRDHYPALGAIAGGSGTLEDFRLDMGDVCPYNGVFFSTETDNWQGMFEVPPALVWAYGSAGLDGGIQYTTPSGEVKSTFASEEDRSIGTAADGSILTIPEVVHRLRDGVDRFFITDINNPSRAGAAQSGLPVMMDGWGQRKRVAPGESDDPSAGVLQFNHLPGGANVLYMDGHAEYVAYGSKFPVMLEAFGEGRNWHESIADGMMGG